MSSFKEITHNGRLDQEAYAKEEQPGMESRFFVPSSWIGTGRTNHDSKDKTCRAPRSRFKSVLSPLSPLAIAPCSPRNFTIATIILFNNFTWPFHIIIYHFFYILENVLTTFQLSNITSLQSFSNLSPFDRKLLPDYSLKNTRSRPLVTLNCLPFKKQPSFKSIS